MDLFDDLPEPSSKPAHSSGTSVVAVSSNKAVPDTSKASLYDDIFVNEELSEKPKKPLLADDTDKSKVGEGKSASINGDESKRKLDEQAEVDSKTKKLKRAIYSINSYLAERKGERDEMQDAHLIIEDFTKELTDLHPTVYRMSLYGVFDGHGGVKASRRGQHYQGVEKDIYRSF